MIFLADTLAFYQIGIALYGGLLGVVTNYADGDHRNRVLRVSREWSATAIAKLQERPFPYRLRDRILWLGLPYL